MHIDAEQVGEHDKFHDIGRSLAVFPAIDRLNSNVQLFGELRDGKTVFRPEIADILTEFAFSGIESGDSSVKI